MYAGTGFQFFFSLLHRLVPRRLRQNETGGRLHACVRLSYPEK